MDKLNKLLMVANGEIKADIVIKNGNIVDVYNGKIIKADVAISDDLIAGIGKYSGVIEIDASNKYITPGFIDAHIHIESAYVTPEELGRMIVPYGTTTIVADPHEIVNVLGFTGLEYMIKSAENTQLDIKYMIPSCVPCTPFENSGTIFDAKKIEQVINHQNILGLGEFMDFNGIINRVPETLEKILVAQKYNKIIDGHAPSLVGNRLNTYVASGIRNDHECSKVEEMQAKISRGMYVMLREGSACNDLRILLRGVTKENSRRCILCSDDRQPKTILEVGHMNNHLKICVEEGIDPITAIQMATLNICECYEMRDRGGIAPSLRADICILEDLKDFKATNVFIAGKEIARDGKYLEDIKKIDIEKVRTLMNIKDFSKEKLKTHLKSNKVNVITLVKGGVLTKKEIETIEIDKNGEFVFDATKDIVKIAVVERHKGTGNVGVGFIKGYGLKCGAIALSIAHDSHNLIVVGSNDDDMEFAINNLEKQGGGIIIVKDKEILENMPLEIGGLMSQENGKWVDKKLRKLHEVAHNMLKISKDLEPIMTLCFMSLIVIPELKITDRGIFDVDKFKFIDLEAEE